MSELTKALVDLASIDAYPTPTMNESDFVKFLLPLIANVDNVKDIDMTIWLTAAGNAHRQIDVIGPTKQVLFTVPALLARVPTINPSIDRDSADVSSIVHHYGALRKVEHPVTADLWFAEAMRSSIIPVDEQEHVNNLKAWLDIYFRYGISTDRLLNGGTTTLSPKPNETIAATATPADDMSGDFDDL
jgi:hypothetical protein